MIYLDHAAATPVSKIALNAMRPYFSSDFFNPSAAYLPAKKVEKAYENTKNQIAHTIGAKGTDLIITAGATEANNLAFTAVSSENSPANIPADTSQESHGIASENPSAKILYLKTEHASVRNLAKTLGGAEIEVDKFGRIDLNDLKNKITDKTEFISIALVNNELGTIQPLAEVAAFLREIKLNRLKQGIKTPLLLHSDASQALSLLDVNVARLGVDLLTLNSAKVYGPKGVGALYVSHDAHLKPLTLGGGQENGLRSGTENVPGVIGFAAAIEEAKAHTASNRKKYAHFKQLFLKNLKNYELIGEKTPKNPANIALSGKSTSGKLDNFVNLCYNGIDGERLVFLLEEKEIYVATGAACAASKGEKSHVLKAIGLSDTEIAGSLRLTFGETNTEEQILTAAKILNEVVKGEYERINR